MQLGKPCTPTRTFKNANYFMSLETMAMLKPSAITMKTEWAPQDVPKLLGVVEKPPRPRRKITKPIAKVRELSPESEEGVERSVTGKSRCPLHDAVINDIIGGSHAVIDVDALPNAIDGAATQPPPVGRVVQDVDADGFNTSPILTLIPPDGGPKTTFGEYVDWAWRPNRESLLVERVEIEGRKHPSLLSCLEELVEARRVLRLEYEDLKEDEAKILKAIKKEMNERSGPSHAVDQGNRRSKRQGKANAKVTGKGKAKLEG